MAIITSANTANAIVKLIAADALPALVGNLVLGNLVNRDFEPALGSSGDTINVPLPPVLSANNIAEGGSVTAQAASLGNAQIVLNTHAECSFQIPDVTKILAHPDLIMTFMRPAVIAVAEKVENDIASIYPFFTANAAVGGVSAMDEARIDLAETALFDQKMPNGPKYLVVSSTAYSQMRQIPRFSEYQTVGPNVGSSPMITGELPGAGPLGANGRIKDFLVFRSQYVKKVSTTTFNIAMGRDAVGLAVRRLPQPLPGTGAIAEYAEMGNFGLRIVMSYQPNTLSQQFTIDVLYGVGILRNQFGVQVQSN